MLKYDSFSNYSEYGSKSSDWFFIDSGESLVLLIDGKRVGFSGDGSIEHRKVGDGYVSETAFYGLPPHILTKKQIKQIAYAKEIQAKIIGQDGFINANFSEDNIANVKEFYNECVLNNTTTSNDNP